jgi:transglutaminase/protease-like cytokinesis protein 3
LSNSKETLKFEKGHCNPKATLFKEMLQMIGIEARLHFVTIKSDILHGIFNSS